jgi:threonine synthase
MYACDACGREYALTADAPWRCDCGHALDFADHPLPDGGPTDPDRDRGLWAFSEFLPVEKHVTLGEGWTPLVDAPEWDAAFKLESLFPTGSFKDRGAAVTLSLAAKLGVDRVVEDSSGNAGHAVATYAARAGIDAEIYVPAGVKPAKREAIERTGATAVRIDGDRQAVTDACRRAVEDDGDPGWYASHAWQPAFFAGTATFALELAAQRDWEVPDVVVTPLGHGTLFLGAYRGFRALLDAGWVDDLPRLVGAQAAGVAPVVEALHGRDAAAGENGAADGIQIADPARRGQILDAIDATGGDAVAVDAATTRETLGRLRTRGIDVEPTCATAPAALDALRERGVVGSEEDVVVALTGTGLKA